VSELIPEPSLVGQEEMNLVTGFPEEISRGRFVDSVESNNTGF